MSIKIHTKRRPFCGNPPCPCHRDLDLIEDYLEAPLREERLTMGQFTRCVRGEIVTRFPKYLCDPGTALPSGTNTPDREPTVE